jgi:HAD superfamily hydrolase (TIGR01450 family)
MRIRSFKSVVSKYKTVFFDAFGVLKNYKGLIPGIENTFTYLEEQGINYFILTNDASRSPLQLAEKYQKLGIPNITEDRIVSSGMLAKEYLTLKVKKGAVAFLGTEESAHYIETNDLKTVPISKLDIENSDDINALVFLDDEGFDWNHDINKVVNLLRMKNIPAIVANTDYAYPVAKHQVAIAVGSLADMVETIVGKQFIRFGKPDAQMFNFAYEHSLNNGVKPGKDRILMVGDTLITDIIGGNKFGLDTVLVLTGNTLPEQADVRIKTTGIIPTYICESAVIEKEG